VWSKGTIVAQSEFTVSRQSFTATYQVIIKEIPSQNLLPYFLFQNSTDYRYQCEVRFRNRMPVTSSTFGFDSYRPKNVSIYWPRKNYLAVLFDDEAAVECDWSFGGTTRWGQVRETEKLNELHDALYR
jgi:hypothetical protein